MRHRLRGYVLCFIAILTCGVLAACASAADTADSSPSAEPSTSPTDEPEEPDEPDEPEGPVGPDESEGPEATEPTDPAEDETETNDRSITIISTPWEETVAVSYLWQHALQQDGYQVEVRALSDPAVAYAALSAGEADMFFGAWMPDQKADVRDKSDSLEDLGPWFKDAATTIVVPKYVKAKTIKDLSKVRKKVDGAILGPESSSPLSRTVKNKVLPEYGLGGLSLRPSSTPALVAELERATEAREPIAATLWHPHWAYRELPIKDLADPKNALGKPSKIHTVVRNDLRAEDAAFGKALDDFEMNDAQLESLMATMHRDSGDQPSGAAERWASKHDKFVTGMLD